MILENHYDIFTVLLANLNESTTFWKWQLENTYLENRQFTNWQLENWPL